MNDFEQNAVLINPARGRPSLLWWAEQTVKLFTIYFTPLPRYTVSLRAIYSLQHFVMRKYKISPRYTRIKCKLLNNVIRKVYSLGYSKILKLFFMPHGRQRVNQWNNVTESNNDIKVMAASGLHQ